MPRKKLIRQSDFPYHVVSRTNNKEWFKLELSEVWDIFNNALIHANNHSKATIHAFVLMSNHYHLLITTPNADIDFFMMNFNRYISNKINQKSGVINHKFANRYNWSIINKESYLYNVYRYIYQNPVRAGITSHCWKYPYSSLNRSSCVDLKVEPVINYDEYANWFEEKLRPDFYNVMSNSLKKAQFKYSCKTKKAYVQILEKVI